MKQYRLKIAIFRDSNTFSLIAIEGTIQCEMKEQKTYHEWTIEAAQAMTPRVMTSLSDFSTKCKTMLFPLAQEMPFGTGLV